jgi:hypothetical protein
MTDSVEPTVRNQTVVPVGSCKQSLDLKKKETETKIKEKSPTKFGKANPIRDSILLVSFLGIMMLMTADYGQPKKNAGDDDVKSSFDSITEMLKILAKNATMIRRKDQCALFLYTGSIPNTGLSYFAGRNYTIGEIILEDDQTFPVGDIYASKSALILKYHPKLFNVQGVLYTKHNEINGDRTMQLRVSKPITVGDEIFVEYNDILHTHSIYNHIPSDSDYNQTAEIVIDALRSVSDQQERNGRTICSMAPVMRFVKRTVERFNPMVATLLPESQKRANRFRKLPPSIALLSNQSLINLQQSAVCVDDLQLEQQVHDDQNATIVVAQHRIRKGNVVTTIPLYIMETGSSGTCNIEEQDCKISQRDCFAYKDLSTIQLCPLGPIMNDVYNINEPNFTTIENIANVEYRWSKHRAILNFKMLDTFKYSTSVMAWDVIALRDISVGDKVCLKPFNIFYIHIVVYIVNI